MDLYQRPVPGFSTGFLLAPRGWTFDLASHYIIHSSNVTLACAMKADSNDIAPDAAFSTHDEDRLPIGSSSNTARFECMVGENEGTTLYVTELFVPRASSQISKAVGVDASLVWNADRVRNLLHHVVSSKDNATRKDNSRSFSCGMKRSEATKVWVSEITNESANCTRCNEAETTTDKKATPFSSLYDAVCPFFHIFVEVVLALNTAEAKSPLETVATYILNDLGRQYHTPALRLAGFRSFTHCSSDPTSLVPLCSSYCPSSTTLSNTTYDASVVEQLCESCAPSVAAYIRPAFASSFWSTSLYSATGGFFVQFLLPSDKQSGTTTKQNCIAADTWWNLSCDAVAAEYLKSTEVERDAKRSSVTPGASTNTTPFVLQHLLQDQLHLHWEGLSASIGILCPQTGNNDFAEGLNGRAEIAVATLPLDTLATPTSLYSFVSVERAWEAHVAQCMKAIRNSKGKPEEDGRDCTKPLMSWKLHKLSTTPSLTDEMLTAARVTAERQGLEIDNPLLTAAERAMVYMAAKSGQSPIVPRCSTYVLHLVMNERVGVRVEQKTRSEGQLQQEVRSGEKKSSSNEWYLLQLHNPRVHSRHAAVVCMLLSPSVPAGGKKGLEMVDMQAADENGNISQMSQAADCEYTLITRWAAALSYSYRLAPFAPSLWLPRDAGRTLLSGVCGRSGRLVLHIPTGDTRYTNVRLAPVPAKSFTSLGSIAAWVQRGASRSSVVVSSLNYEWPTFSQVSAVWTLVGDGRSAAAYLEDVLMEYMYDTGSKNLNNISQPSQHTRQPGVLVVRRRQRQKVKATRTGTGGATAAWSRQVTAASVLGSHEVCSAWVDVGAIHRLLLRASDVGVGEVLLTEVSLVGPHTEKGTSEANERKNLTSAAEEVASREEEDAVEKWIEGITASAIPEDPC